MSKLEIFLRRLFSTTEAKTFDLHSFAQTLGNALHDQDFSKLNRYYKKPYSFEDAKKIYYGEIDGRILTRGGREVKLLSININAQDQPKYGLAKEGQTFPILFQLNDTPKEGKYFEPPYAACFYCQEDGHYLPGKVKENDFDLESIEVKVENMEDFLMYLCQQLESINP